ncbi:MAG: EAL domain-containing protein [Oscillospiraceae bacterium]|nr:EAL domain-containing protein [Oscillospiraceae bacterium]
MKRYIIYVTGVLLLFVMLPLFSVKAAAEEEKVVRVGWYESAFHHTDSFGRRTGYGYEYQQRIATYTGWKYEYVEGSWSDLYEMLTAGEIDLLSDVSYTEERAEKILFSARGMGSEDYHAFIASDNTEIRPDNYSTFNGKRVGVNKNSIQEQLFAEWAKTQKISPEIIELTGKTPELLAMLQHGEIDVLVTLDAYGSTADVVPVCKIGSADSFFGINLNRPDLKIELDAAMHRILEENRNYNQELAEEFNQASGISHFLTDNEIDWVSDKGSIRVGYLDGLLPFCTTDADTQTLTGTLNDYLIFAETCEKNAELSFESVSYDTAEDALQALADGETDCLFPISMSAYDGEQREIIITEPLIRTEMFAVVRTVDRQGVSRDAEIRVGVSGDSPSYDSFLMDFFPKWKGVHYESLDEGILALARGDVDCMLVSNYRLNQISRQCAKYKLSTLTTGETMELSFAVRRENDKLYSVLNKINRLLPEESVNSSLTNYSFPNRRVTVGEFLVDNLAMTITATSVFLFVIILLAVANMRTATKASEGRQLISEAERDLLTGLYNKSFFNAYVNRFYREHPDKPMDAIVLNVNRFHTLNTLNGRPFGDEVLRTLGEEVAEFARETESIAGRPEGDHFNIYCPHREDYLQLLERFQNRMNRIARSEDIRLRMGVMPWQKGTEPSRMFDQAWLACNMIRDDYRNHLMIYDEEVQQRDMVNQRLCSDLGRALEEKEFEVYYQPKYDIQSKPPKLYSAEALVRWNHPQLGTVQPGDFVPLFEDSGQISLMDSYVWGETARQIADWRDRCGVTVPVSVNLSRVDVFEPDLSNELERISKLYGLKPGMLNLEVTESAYTEDTDLMIQVVGKLREKGYEIEMDDFGSGYSSLNMLSSMPVDVLKMDMKFVQNIEHSETDLRLVRLILDIAKNLNLRVVAEGVETQGQLTLLEEAGCDLVQGFYFSPPLTAKEFEKRILRTGN